MNPSIEEFEDLPPRLESAREMRRPNEDFILTAGPMTVRQNGKEFAAAEGVVTFRWLPSPRVTFEVYDNATVFALDEAALEIHEGKILQVVLLGANYPVGSLKGRIRSPSPHESEFADRMTFHVPNFHRYLGDPVRNADATGAWKARLQLTANDWSIYIDEVPNAENLRKALREEGGYALTQRGSLKRVDGASFSIADGADLLSSLFYFLSFARGNWCGPVLPVAYRAADQVWSQWEPPRIRSWRAVRSWFPRDEPSVGRDLQGGFPGYLRLWNDPLWNEPLKNVLHWYVEANTNAGGIEGGIILVQSALELLGWICLVEDPAGRTFSSSRFDSLSASERINHLLTLHSVPSSIPNELNALASAASALGTTDGPDVFVKLRNSLVHPKKSKRQKLAGVSDRARFEALSLGLWYLELVLLKVFGYEGLYYSRLRSGTNEAVRSLVPWV